MTEFYAQTLVRNYFEKRGSFDGVTSEIWWKDLRAQEFFHSNFIWDSIGIKVPSKLKKKGLSSEDYYKIRRNLLSGKKRLAGSMLERRDLTEEDLGIEYHRVLPTDLNEVEELLYVYYLNSNKVVDVNGKWFRLNDILEGAFRGGRQREAIVNYLLNGADLSVFIREVRKSDKNAIIEDVLYVREDIDLQRCNKKIFETVGGLITKYTDRDIVLMEKLLGRDISDKEYDELTMLANFLDLTVSEMLVDAGFYWIELDDRCYAEGIALMPVYEDLRVYFKSSSNASLYVNVLKEDFKDLYEYGALKHVEFINVEGLTDMKIIAYAENIGKTLYEIVKSASIESLFKLISNPETVLSVRELR